MSMAAYMAGCGRRGEGPTEKNSKTFGVKKFWWTMDNFMQKVWIFLSKKYKKVQKNNFLPFFKISFFIMLELIKRRLMALTEFV